MPQPLSVGTHFGGQLSSNDDSERRQSDAISLVFSEIDALAGTRELNCLNSNPNRPGFQSVDLRVLAGADDWMWTLSRAEWRGVAVISLRLECFQVTLRCGIPTGKRLCQNQHDPVATARGTDRRSDVTVLRRAGSYGTASGSDRVVLVLLRPQFTG